MNTLSQVMDRLIEEGYTGNIPSDEIKLLNPTHWIIDRIYRFEGDTNPSVNSILYAISRKDGTRKTLLVNAYSIDSEKDISNFIDKLETSER